MPPTTDTFQLLALPPELLGQVAQHLWPQPDALWALMSTCKLLRSSTYLTQGAPQSIHQRLYNGRAGSRLARWQHGAEYALCKLHLTMDRHLERTATAQSAIQGLQLEIARHVDELQSIYTETLHPYRC